MIVSRFKTIFAALLLLLWLPATSYCFVENASLLQPSGCCEENHHGSTGKERSCDTGCGIVPSVGIHLKCSAPAASVWLGELIAVCFPEAPEDAGLALGPNAGDSPPHALRLAVLRARTSLPTRGPSLAA